MRPYLADAAGGNENAVFAQDFSPIRGAGKGGANPVKDMAKLVADLRKAADAATVFCARRQVTLPALDNSSLAVWND